MPTRTPPFAPPVEQKRRTLLKTLSWRAVASLDTLMIAFVVMWLTHPTTAAQTAGVAGTIALVEVPNKLLLYYVHERLWARLAFGRARAPEYQI